MLDKIQTNLCPGCGEKITKRTNKGTCPKCGVSIKLLRTSEGKRNRFHYELAVAPIEEVQVTEEKSTKKEIFSGIGVVIYEMSNGDVHYQVDITVRMERVVCPKCKLVAFEPRQTEGGIKHKCSRCNAFTLFNFKVYRNKL